MSALDTISDQLVQAKYKSEITRYEQGSMPIEEEKRFYQKIVSNGDIGNFPESYHIQANSYIEQGAINPPPKAKVLFLRHYTPQPKKYWK